MSEEQTIDKTEQNVDAETKSVGSEGLLNGEPSQTPSKSPTSIVSEDGKIGDEFRNYLRKTVGDAYADANELTKFNNIGDIAKSYVEISKAFSKKVPENMVAAPTETSSQEEKDAFYNKIGRPESPDGYTVKEEVAKVLDPEAFNEFKGIAHKLGLTKSQFDALIGYETDRASKYVEKSTMDNVANQQKIRQQLQAELGNKFDYGIAAAKKLVKDYAVPDDVVQMVEKDARLLSFLTKIGQDLYGEADIKGEMNGANAYDVQNEINKLRNSDAYFDKRNPDHNNVVARVRHLRSSIS